MRTPAQPQQCEFRFMHGASPAAPGLLHGAGWSRQPVRIQHCWNGRNPCSAKAEGPVAISIQLKAELPPQDADSAVEIGTNLLGIFVGHLAKLKFAVDNWALQQNK